MNKRMIELVEKIHNNEIVDRSYFDDEMIQTIINTPNISLFHLILNYIEKIDYPLSSYIMDAKKEKNNKLIASFDIETNLFERDKIIISKIKEYEKRSNEAEIFYNKGESEIENKYKNILKDYNEIRTIIFMTLDAKKSVDDAINRAKREGLVVNESNIEIIKNFYSDVKELFDKYDELVAENDKLNEDIYKIANRNYSKGLVIDIDNSKLFEEELKDNNVEVITRLLISTFFEEVPENFIKNIKIIVSF